MPWRALFLFERGQTRKKRFLARFLSERESDFPNVLFRLELVAQQKWQVTS
jgi:hypothetical protein